MEKDNKRPFKLSKNSEEFVSSLFLKIGKNIVKDQENVGIDDENEFGSLVRVNSQFDKTAQMIETIYQLENALNFRLNSEDSIDEEVLTIHRFNDFLVESQKIALEGEGNIIWVASQVSKLFFSMRDQASREIPQMENLIMSSVSNDYENEDKTIKDLDNLDLDVEEAAKDIEKDIEKYISMFKGEEYEDDGKDYPEGSFK